MSDITGVDFVALQRRPRGGRQVLRRDARPAVREGVGEDACVRVPGRQPHAGGDAVGRVRARVRAEHVDGRAGGRRRRGDAGESSSSTGSSSAATSSTPASATRRSSRIPTATCWRCTTATRPRTSLRLALGDDPEQLRLGLAQVAPARRSVRCRRRGPRRGAPRASGRRPGPARGRWPPRRRRSRRWPRPARRTRVARDGRGRSACRDPAAAPLCARVRPRDRRCVCRSGKPGSSPRRRSSIVTPSAPLRRTSVASERLRSARSACEIALAVTPAACRGRAG